MILNLKAARQQRKLLQKDIAKLLNVDQAVYSRWENGKTPLNRVTRLAIASVLDFDIDAIDWPEVQTKKEKGSSDD